MQAQALASGEGPAFMMPGGDPWAQQQVGGMHKGAFMDSIGGDRGCKLYQ